MKLRIRFQSRRVLIEVTDPQCTLQELLQTVAAQLSLTDSLTNSSFTLSLDGKIPLPLDQNKTLSDLGIVGGDLLHVILLDTPSTETSSGSLPSTSTTSDINQSNYLSTQNVGQSSSLPFEEPSTSSNTSSSLTQDEDDTDTETSSESISSQDTSECTSDNARESQTAGPSKLINNPSEKQRKLEYAPKVLLCRDGTPYSLQSSYEVAAVATMHQAVCVAIHVLMLETGFVNYSIKDGESQHTQQPTSSQNSPEMSNISEPIISQDWKIDSGARFQYMHPACPGLVCSVVCSSLGPYVLAHGMSNSPSCHEVHQCRLSAADFVKGNVDLKSSSAVDVYKNLQRLSLAVKDQLAYPLLSSMRHELNLEEIYGLMALPTEVKLMLLCLLPVKDILNMSATCREFQTIASDNILWQHLCFRDFRLLKKGKYSTWKMEYTRRYKDFKDRERDRQRATFVFPGQGMYNPPGFFPPYPPFPPGIIGGRHDMFPNVPFMPGGINPGTIPPPGFFPRPRFDPFGPMPDIGAPPGRRPGRGRGRGGFPPGPFF